MNRYANLGSNLARVLAASPVALIVLVAGAGQAMADHDPNVIHACIKNGGIQVVSSAADCKNGETPVVLVTEAALAALKNANASLDAHINAVELLAKRLHGYSAAVISHKSGGTASGPPGHYLIRLTFCDSSDPSQSPCDAAHGYVLEADNLTESDKGTVVTFDAANTPDFPFIASLLTNGADDLLNVETEYYHSNGAPGGSSGSLGSENYWFNLYPQVSSAAGIKDLDGLQIESINISIDYLQLFFDQNNQSTIGTLEYRVFFGLSH